MSDHATAVAEHHDQTVVPSNPFDNQDVRGFRADDAEAGANIGKMLVAFFFYSLCAMAFVTWWAFGAFQANSTNEDLTVQAHATEDGEGH